MLSATAAVLINTSAAGTRRGRPFRGTRRSETIACRAVDRRWRISSCWCREEGDHATDGLRSVGRVQRREHHVPVSAALSAVSSVSMSRISPIRMRSDPGAARAAARS